MTRRPGLPIRSCSTIVGVLAISALGVTACGPREPRTDAEKLARGRELVQQMSSRLAAAPTLRIVSRETREQVKADGTKAVVSLGRDTRVRRPDRLYSKTSGDVENEFFYDGVGATLVIHKDKVFGQSRMPETLDGTLDAISERYGVSMPLADLVYSDPARALFSDTTKGGYTGRENLEGKPSYHLAFNDEGVQWELWLPVDGEPLPRKMRVVQTKRRGQPASDVTFVEWDLLSPVEVAVFDPKVPGDYEGVALIQRASILKNLPPDEAGTPAPAKK